MKKIFCCCIALLLVLLFRFPAFAQSDTDMQENENALVSATSMIVYPNPNSGMEVYINFEGFESNDLLVVVYDMLGREMFSKIQVVEKNGFLFSFDPALPKGIYLIIASADDAVFRQKLIVR